MFEIFAAQVHKELNQTRTPLKRRIKIGTEFIENNRKQTVSRVTDLDFDTIETIDGKMNVQTRNLGLFDNFSFVNSISQPINLLRV